jgi:hypothetical protein
MADAATNYASYLTEASANLQPQVDAQLAAVNQAATIQEQGVTAQEKAATAQQSLVQTTYGALANEINVEQTNDTASAQETGKEQMGAAKSNMALSGVDPRASTGSFAAPETAASIALSQNLAKISSTYGAKQETLTAQMNQDVGQLSEEIAGYQAQGDNIMANVATQQQSLLQWQQSNAESIASEQVSADNQEQTYELEVAKYNQTVSHDNAMEGVANMRAAIYAAKSGYTMDSSGNLIADPTESVASNMKIGNSFKAVPQKTAAGLQTGTTYTDSHGDPITLTTYLNGVYGRPPTASEIANALNSSGNSADQQIAKALLSARTTMSSSLPGDSTTSLDALQQKYPYIFSNTFSSYAASGPVDDPLADLEDMVESGDTTDTGS